MILFMDYVMNINLIFEWPLGIYLGVNIKEGKTFPSAKQEFENIAFFTR